VKELALLLIGVNVVASTLCQVVELWGILLDCVVPLSQIHEIRKLVKHCATVM
jgi:hypothetical protein